MDLGQNIKDNQSAYTWGGAVATGAGLLILYTGMTATAPWWMPVAGVGLLAGGLFSAGAAMNADKINASGILDFSAAPTPNGTTKVAVTGTAPAPVIEQKIAKAPEPQPEVTAPPHNIAQANKGAETGRG